MAKIFWSNRIRYVCVVQMLLVMPLGTERSNYDQILSNNNSLCDDSNSTEMPVSRIFLKSEDQEKPSAVFKS